MGRETSEDEDIRQRKLAEYLAENLGHELCLALVSFTNQVPGALQRTDTDGIERGLDNVADALREVAAAIRERHQASPG